MPSPKTHPHDTGILGLPGDVSPWDIRFDPGQRHHLERIGDRRVRFVVWAEPRIVEGRLVIRHPGGGVRSYGMTVSGRSGRFTYFGCDLDVDGPIDYSFAFRSQAGNPVYFVVSGVSGSVERIDRFRLEPGDVRAGSPPRWARGALIYQIFPDRFANGDPTTDPDGVVPWGSPPAPRQFQGGDLWGVARRLGHLEDLGVDAIYLNPIFSSPSNHRYDTIDYYSVDPILGGDAALQRLVDEAHRRGIRIILDASLNHVHPGFFAFADLLRRGKRSAYRDWFVVNDWPLRLKVRRGQTEWQREWLPVWAEQVGVPIERVSGIGPPVEPTYDTWYSVPTMPRVNLAHPDARQYMLSVARHWVGEFGIDGWRMDVARYVDSDFWDDFRTAVKDVNPDAYLLAEIFGDVNDWLQGTRFDATMNYTFRSICRAFFAKGEIDGAEFLDEASRLVHLYGWETTLVNHNLLGSHDTPRFLTEAGGEVWRVVLATVFQLTFPGSPGVYYGDEVGLDGGDDPGCRGAFPWGSPEVERYPVGDAIRQITRLRRRHRALREGDFGVVAAWGRAVAFERRSGRSRIVVVLNLEPRTVRFELGAEVVLWGDATLVDGRVSVAARSAAILRG
jgi:glycosidase